MGVEFCAVLSIYSKAIRKKTGLLTLDTTRHYLMKQGLILCAAFIEICVCASQSDLIFLMGVNWCNFYAKAHIFSTELLCDNYFINCYKQ